MNRKPTLAVFYAVAILILGGYLLTIFVALPTSVEIAIQVSWLIWMLCSIYVTVRTLGRGINKDRSE